jgi:hypothetical protein
LPGLSQKRYETKLETRDQTYAGIAGKTFGGDEEASSGVV